MNLDEAAAAFGLFHLAFASLTQQLAAAVFYIRRIREPNLQFEDVFNRKFSKLREDLKDELSQSDGRSSTDRERQCLERLCAEMGDLATWRNARGHPRVQIDDNGITIYDWRTRKELNINRDKCVKKINEALYLTAMLDQSVGGLLRELDEDRTIDQIFEELFRTVDQDREAE